MANAVGKRTAKVLDAMGEAIVRGAQRNLGTRRIGKNKSYGSTRSRKLPNSLTFQRDGMDLKFGSPLPYAKFIHWGVSGTHRQVKNSPFKYTNKQPPIAPILQWIKMKPVRLRDASGRFIAQTKSKMKGLAFVIARRIKKMGIPKLEYFTESWETEYPRWKSKIADAVALDTLDGIGGDLNSDNIKEE